MKKAGLLGVLLVAAGVGEAMAQCSTSTGGPNLNQGAITSAFGNQLVCARSATKKWSEEHRTGGTLFEYAKGPTDPVDPRKEVGTWSVTGTGTNARIVYTYNAGGGTYTWSVKRPSPGNYAFCNGATVIATATVQAIPGSGPNPCP